MRAIDVGLIPCNGFQSMPVFPFASHIPWAHTLGASSRMPYREPLLPETEVQNVAVQDLLAFESTHNMQLTFLGMTAAGPHEHW